MHPPLVHDQFSNSLKAEEKQLGRSCVQRKFCHKSLCIYPNPTHSGLAMPVAALNFLTVSCYLVHCVLILLATVFLQAEMFWFF